MAATQTITFSLLSCRNSRRVENLEARKHVRSRRVGEPVGEFGNCWDKRFYCMQTIKSTSTLQFYDKRWIERMVCGHSSIAKWCRLAHKLWSGLKIRQCHNYAGLYWKCTHMRRKLSQRGRLEGTKVPLRNLSVNFTWVNVKGLKQVLQIYFRTCVCMYYQYIPYETHSQLWLTLEKELSQKRQGIRK